AQTPGMRVIGIRCVSVTTGGAIGMPRALLRGLLLSLVLPAVIMDDYGRGLHDRWTGSLVAKR
nr:RDD family protein [Longispora sp. (in: high G+C Gram-positive bacteria)]